VGIVGIQLPFTDVALLVPQITVVQAILVGVGYVVLRVAGVLSSEPSGG
jgi:hypothetical protein